MTNNEFKWECSECGGEFRFYYEGEYDEETEMIQLEYPKNDKEKEKAEWWFSLDTPYFERITEWEFGGCSSCDKKARELQKIQGG